MIACISFVIILCCMKVIRPNRTVQCCHLSSAEVTIPSHFWHVYSRFTFSGATMLMIYFENFEVYQQSRWLNYLVLPSELSRSTNNRFSHVVVCSHSLGAACWRFIFIVDVDDVNIKLIRHMSSSIPKGLIEHTHQILAHSHFQCVRAHPGSLK
jgi:hypothetical protein